MVALLVALQVPHFDQSRSEISMTFVNRLPVTKLRIDGQIFILLSKIMKPTIIVTLHQVLRMKLLPASLCSCSQVTQSLAPGPTQAACSAAAVIAILVDVGL